jgi:hypothetical protein
VDSATLHLVIALMMLVFGIAFRPRLPCYLARTGLVYRHSSRRPQVCPARHGLSAAVRSRRTSSPSGPAHPAILLYEIASSCYIARRGPANATDVIRSCRSGFKTTPGERLDHRIDALVVVAGEITFDDLFDAIVCGPPVVKCRGSAVFQSFVARRPY